MLSYKLRAELRSHGADVRSVTVSHDGTIATCSRDRSAMIWNVESSEPRLVLKGHEHFVNDVAFVKSGKLVTASGDKSLRVWDINTGKSVLELTGHTSPVCSVAALPTTSGETVISAAWDGTARVWDVESGMCLNVLKGHEGAVWSAMGLPDGRFVTVGADKTVRIWKEGSGDSTVLPTVHTDVVRGVIPGPNGGFITVSNDSTMAFWQPQGNSFYVKQRMTDLHDGSYTYCVDSLETTKEKWVFVTGGEDNAARVSEADYSSGADASCTQTIMHPGTVWSVALCPNGDIVTACSDNVARVFTTDPSAVADADVLSTFEKIVSERQVSTKVIGGVNVAKLPSAADGLRLPGRKDGENKIVRAGDGTAEVFMWSAADEKWVKVGDVVDGPGEGASLGGGSVNDKKYDFVFEVEIGEGGKKEKLGYNRGENPYFAAQRFIDENEISQEFLDQVAQFIEQQVPADALVQGAGGPSDPLTGSERYVPGTGRHVASASNAGASDPLTGGSRYVPGGQSTSASASASTATESDPLTGGSRYVPGGGQAVPANKLPPPRKLIPHPNGYITYTNTEQLPKIQGKLKQLNSELGELGSEHALSGEEFSVLEESLIPKLKKRGGPTAILKDEDCAVMEKLLKWPTTHVFAVMDVARLVILLPSGVAYMFGKQNGKILDDVLGHMMSTDASAPVYIMGCRFLCNIFKSRLSLELVGAKQETILASAEATFRNTNRRCRETYGSLLINFALMMFEEKAQVDQRIYLMKHIIEKISGGEKDEEVLYRLMTALGTIICGDKECAKKGVELGAASAAAEVAAVSERVQQVAFEIATVIAS